MIRRRFIAVLALLALLTLPVSLLLWLHSASVEPLPLHQTIPSVKLATLKATTISFPDVIDKPTAILAFSADCPHCQNELLHFELLCRRYGSEVYFAAVSLSNEPETSALAKQFGFSFDLLLDKYQETRKAWHIAVVPALFLVDNKNLLRYRRVSTIHEYDRGNYLGVFHLGCVLILVKNGF